MRNALRHNRNLRWLVDVNGMTVDIRKAYDMQGIYKCILFCNYILDFVGLEFQCVFLSTAEPTTAEGESNNPTKTPCNQYVFNTAITRAQSLVVCVGNPFLLLKIEKKVGNENKASCWGEYIRRCMQENNGSFVIPPNLWSDVEDRQDKINTLTKLVYRSYITSASRKTIDSITKAYNTAFEGLPGLQKFQLLLKTALDGPQWKMSEEGTTTYDQRQQAVTHKSGLLKCNLEIVSYRKALCRPLDLTKPVVLKGLKNWKGALNNDLVEVDLYETSKDIRYGKVVNVIKKYHQKKYVCQMDRENSIKFYPIDKKTPCLVNWPKISRDLMKLRKRDIEEGLTSQNQWVVVFEEDSLPQREGDDLPRIKEIITAESARNLLFVVRVIGWEPNHLLPLGAVVESLPLGTTFFHAERILRAEHNISTDIHDEKPSGKEYKEDEPLPTDGVMKQVFTIDPSDARYLDDALSLVRDSDGRYTMAVLITSVEDQLQHGSELDKEALDRATSVYASGSSHSMLPPGVCQKLSLSPNSLRDVIIVSTKVMLEKDSIKITETEIKKGKMESQVQLDYLEAQCLLSRESPSVPLQQKLLQYLSCCSAPGQPDLQSSLQLLYKVAMHLRVQRLKLAAYAYNLSEKESMNSWQAHILVEELMIWANRTVAKYAYDHCEPKDGTILLRQSSPDEQELRELDGSILEHSLLWGTPGISKSQKPTQPLLIPNSTLLELQDAYKSGS